MTRFARLHPFLSFFVLACAIFWACIAAGSIDRFRFWVPIVGAFGPAVAAIVVTGLASGEPAVRALVGQLGRWRVGAGWYLVALGLPLAEDALAAGIATLTGSFSAARLPPVLPIVPAMWVVFLFAAGEELGWRGFALPHLIGPRSPLAASLMVGTLQVVWHWPVLLLPHQYLSGVPVVAWSVFALSEAIIFAWLFISTGGSVLICALYHGASNLGMILYEGIDPALAPWFKCSSSVLTALGVVAWAGRDLSRRRAPMRESTPPLDEWFRVSWDDDTIHLTAAPPGRSAWSDEFGWSAITRVCFKAEGVGVSDGVYVYTRMRPESYVIPIEAAGGAAFWDEVVRRGLFDAELAIEAASAPEGLFCWPRS